MNIRQKEKLINLLDEYCDDNECKLIGDVYNCNEDCPFDCGIEYCPILYIKHQIKKEVKDERRT